MASVAQGSTPPWLSRRPARRSLLWLLFWANTAVVVVALAGLASTPLTVNWPTNVREAVILLGAVAAMLAANLFAMRRVLSPLGRLWAVMRTVDPLRPGQRIAVAARSIEVADLERAFNDMLDRLEEERRDSARRQQAAQDAERRWLALELHDQIGQDLTALMLTIDVAARTADDDRRAAVLDTAAVTARECLERVRTIVTHLRPAGLDELGLTSALLNLCERLTRSSGVRVVPRFSASLPSLDADTRLGVYRIAQESLTNALRHGSATRVDVALDADENGVRLVVTDDGSGIQSTDPSGTGIRGMRERALLLGARLEIGPAQSGGTRVCLDVPGHELVNPLDVTDPQPALRA